MLTRASSRRVAVSKSLLQRLAPLETGVFLPTSSDTDRPHFDRRVARRDYSLRACFGLGFASSCIAGGVALLILLLVNPVDAGAQKIDDAARVSTISLLPADQPSLGRQLWWRLPLSDGDRFPSAAAGSLPVPSIARVKVGSLGYPQ